MLLILPGYLSCKGSRSMAIASSSAAATLSSLAHWFLRGQCSQPGIGNQVYEELLGFRPQVALINEQAYSSGLLKHYLNAGYKAIMMDWDNPASSHPEWNQAYRYLPQKACDQYGTEIPLIWTNSIAFQKFQRYAHGEMDLDEYLNYLSSQLNEEPRTFPLYCNDIEIFNFRPGRYETEANIIDDEWLHIEQVFKTITEDKRFMFIAPSQVLNYMNLPGAANALSLETSEQPLPVKKQSKYNVTRWAVTGRNDLAINTYCWRIYKDLLSDPVATDDDLKELCYLWSSDFRTHITTKRWEKYVSRLSAFMDRINNMPCQPIFNYTDHQETNICHFRKIDDSLWLKHLRLRSCSIVQKGYAWRLCGLNQFQRMLS